MHLGNGIICPVTGISMLAVAVGTAFYSFKRVKDYSKFKVISLTALVFALQMINFAIPSTGSSGHIVGGILLAALLGPHIAFLAMSAILIVQAVFFADGGLLALGCNIFNMGFLACFVAYPLIYKTLKNRPVSGSILASVIALQLGSIAVVAESALSGTIATSELMNFTGLMQTIHLPIGIVEGIVTAVIVLAARFVSERKLSFTFTGLSVIFAGVISHYASQKPDGLEWSLLNITVDAQTQGMLYNLSEIIQTKTAILQNLPMGSIAGLLAVSLIMYITCIIASPKNA